MDDIIKKEEPVVNQNQSKLAVINNSMDLALLKESVEVLAKLTGQPATYVTGAILQGSALGVTNPITALSLFWPMDGKAELKNSALNSLVVEKGVLVEPIEVIEDIAIQYYYYDGKLSDITKEYLDILIEKTIIKPDVNFKGISRDAFINSTKDKILKLNLYKEPRNTENEKKTPIPIILAYLGDQPIYERQTTLRGKVYSKTQKDIIITKEYSYRLSTAIERGIYFDNSNKIKTAWTDLSRMMYKRCLDHLFERLAINPYLVSIGVDTEVRANGRLDDYESLHEEDIIITTNK